MAVKRRPIIPKATEGQLLFITDYKCCVCQEKGDHIHHLDENPKNNNLDNLAFLCFKDHDLTTSKSSLRKKLTKKAIINYRSHHYKVIENRRKQELGNLDKPISKLTNENLLIVVKNALIILELENIKARYFSAEWDKRADLINELDKYANHKNHRLTYAILEFLHLAVSQTRTGMTEKVALCIFSQIHSFGPSFHDKKNKKEVIELAKQCIQIGYIMAYDSFFHLRKINVAMYGLTIIKFIYREAKENKIIAVKREVEKSYEELSLILKRPENIGMEAALETLNVFHADLDGWDLSFPVLSARLMDRLDMDRS